MGIMSNQLFDRVVEIVRGNPSEFEAEVRDIVNHLKNRQQESGGLPKAFTKIWANSQYPHDLIVTAWLLTDSTIGIGTPVVDESVAKKLLTRMLSDEEIEIDSLNPESFQECISGVIFYDDRSKKKLHDALVVMDEILTKTKEDDTYRAIDFAARKIIIGETEYGITSKTWSFLKDLREHRDRSYGPVLQNSKTDCDREYNAKNAKDTLRRKIKPYNVSLLVVSVKGGYKLHKDVKCLYRSQVAIRKTKQGR